MRQHQPRSFVDNLLLNVCFWTSLFIISELSTAEPSPVFLVERTAVDVF